MLDIFKHFWTRSIRRQLMLGITLVHAVLMTIFVTDLVNRQKTFLQSQSLSQTIGLSETLAASCTSWVLSNDFIGLEEVIDSQARFPDLKYAMVVSTAGRVLGHTDRSKVGLYLADDISATLLHGEPESRLLVVNEQLIDICAPIMANYKLIGWARVGISQASISQGLAVISRDGLWYTALAILVGAFFAILMARGITLGLYHLVGVAERVQAGDMHQRTTLDRPDELGILGHNMNAMIDSLVSQKEQLSVTLRSLSEGVLTTDNDGRIILLNPMGAGLIGISEEEALGLQVSELFQITKLAELNSEKPPLESNSWGDGKLIQPGEFLLTVADGRQIPVALSGAPVRNLDDRVVGSVVVFRDVTEEREARQQNIKFQKLESLGVLAGGIAHDFNNILTGILGNINLASSCLDQGSEAWEMLEGAEKATYRAKGLTEQLLTFAKGGQPIRKTVMVSKIVRDVINFNVSGSSTKCHFSIPEDLPNAEIDQGQVSQVLQNIVINAVQSMPEGGDLNISCDGITVAEESPLPLNPGLFIRIRLTDTGCGIPAEELHHIFDPYFSTKRKGSGLGLAVSHSIMVKHGGLIEAQSTQGVGTTLFLYLPAADPGSDVATSSSKACPEGSGTIVVMDDEKLVRQVATQMLQRSGYKTLEAVSGEVALEILQETIDRGQGIDLFIMDLTIPGGIGGKETLEQMLKICPDVKAIVSSGYGNDAVLANFSDFGFKGMVRKPYTKNELIQAVQKAIGNG